MIKILGSAVLWVSLGLVGSGMLNANLQYYFPEHNAVSKKQDLGFSIALGLLGGPFTLVAATVVTGFGATGWTLSTVPYPRSS